ncbi:MAG: DNA polymerase III subunit delta [Clostridia bacterium]|nr:DNA polymerase III subunit delta [Clostridia bacterium]
MSKNLILITGDENYEKEKKLQQIVNDFGELVKGINYIILDKNSVYHLENEINTYPFGFSKKLIIVKIEKKSGDKTENSDNLASDEKADWLTEKLEETLETLDTDVTVVFYGDFQKRSRIYKLVQKSGECIICEKEKEYELLSWCAIYFKGYHVQISTADINYFINLCGTEKLILKNEMDKLIDYAFETKTISKEDIDLLCIRTSDIIIFDLTDSLGNKDKKKALNALNELLANKEPIQKIVIMIAKHFKSLLVAKIATIDNKNVMEELSTKSTYAANKYKSQARSFSVKELSNMIQALAMLDIDSKLGKIDLRIGLEKVICG